MKELKGFYSILFMLLISLFIWNLDKEYGIYFDENYRHLFKIVMPVGAEMIFIFIYSIIEKVVDKNN